MKHKVLKPSIGDIYWFHGGYESYLKCRAVRVVKVISGFKCNMKIVTPKELDYLYDAAGIFTLDVRQLFSVLDYENHKEHLEEVTTPMKKEGTALQISYTDGLVVLKRGRQTMKLSKDEVATILELNNANS